MDSCDVTTNVSVYRSGERWRNYQWSEQCAPWYYYVRGGVVLRRSLLPTLPHSMNPKIIYLRGCNYELAYIDVTTTVVGRLAGSVMKSQLLLFCLSHNIKQEID